MAIQFQPMTAKDLDNVRGPRNEEAEAIASEIRAYLSGIKAGNGGQIVMDDVSRTTSKNRIRSAADDLGIVLEFKRGRGKEVVFVVTSTPNGTDNDGE